MVQGRPGRYVLQRKRSMKVMRFVPRYAGIVMTIVVLGAALHPALAQRAWHVSGQGSFVTAADCRDCDDDLGILFECRGLGRAADVSVPAVAVEQRPGGRRNRIEFFVDGLGMSFDADVERQGLVGYVPKLQIHQNDPLIERLAAGSSLRVIFAGRSNTLTLRGARAALAAFASQCAWSSAKALAQPLADTVPSPQAEPGAPAQPSQPSSSASVTGPAASAEHPAMRWQYYAGRRGEAARLIFGIPDTDNAVLAASCLPGATRALVELLASPSGLDPGRPVQIGIHSSRGVEGVRGVVNRAGHATFSSEPSGRLWWALQSGGAATFSVEGRPAGFVESPPTDRAIVSFLAGCR
jgi:hypothetical protein